MKVLHVVATTTTHKFNFPLYRALNQMGFENHFTYNECDTYFLSDLEGLALNKRRQLHSLSFEREFLSLGHFGASKGLHRLIEQEDFDLVHTYGPIPAIHVRMLRKFGKFKGKVFCTNLGLPFVKYTGGRKEKLFLHLEKSLFRYADLYFVVSRSDKNYLEERIRSIADKIVLLPGVGVDIDYYDTSSVGMEEVEHLRNSLSIPKKAKVLGFLGRPTADKGIDTLFSVFEQLKSTMTERELYLVVIGGLPKTERKKDFDSFAEFVNRINHSRLSRYIKLTGFVNDVRPYLMNLDVLVAPSRREGLSTVALEAMSMGIPVVSSDIPSFLEQISDGLNGYCCKANSDDFVEKIARVITEGVICSKDQLREYISKTFSTRNTLKVYLDKYQTLI